MLAREVIIAPLITEKSMSGTTRQQYAFEVHRRATKTQIRQAIAEIFKFHRFQGLIHCPTVLFPKPFPPSQNLISSHFDHSAHRDRKIPVDRRTLR